MNTYENGSRLEAKVGRGPALLRCPLARFLEVQAFALPCSAGRQLGAVVQVLQKEGHRHTV